MSDWALPIQATHWLRDNIPHGARVLELGSGDGTVRLVEWFKVVAIEHDRAWYDRTKKALEGTRGEVRFAPITRYGCYDWYDARHLPKDYAAIVVDGPPGRIGRRGIMDNLGRLNLDAAMLFDDCHRKDEWHIALAMAEQVRRPITLHPLANGRAFATIGAATNG